MDQAVRVANFRTDQEAEMAAALLQRAGIPFLFRSAETAGMPSRPSGADLLVLPSDLEAAREVLGDLASEEPAE